MNIVFILFGLIVFISFLVIARLYSGNKKEKEKLILQIIELEKSKTQLQSEKENLEKEIKNNHTALQNKYKEMELTFENLANRIFEEKTRSSQTIAEKNLQNIISPLREKMGEFQKRVEDTYNQEMRERASLKAEIHQIIQTTQKMGIEAQNLTKALRGDVKTQGAWGEFVLEKLLESVGLKAGVEYTIQGKDMRLKSDEGNHLKPDVILNLPDDKHLIIDSKVSLVSYERAMSSDGADRERHLQDFIRSLREHVRGLSLKNYQGIEALRNPEFVLLFFPLEGAFFEILKLDPEIFQNAWDKNVVIVGPTTLLATLKTVASLWKQEKQSKNASAMARECGLLYDKFCLLLSDLEKVGEYMKKADSSFHEVVAKLNTGRGNLIDKVEKIKLLGAKTTKQIPEKFKAELDVQETLEVEGEI